jgi:tight adherence protein B
MILLAAACWGGVAALLVAACTGRLPRRLTRSTRARVMPRREWLRPPGAAFTPWQFWTGSLLAGAVTFAIVTLVTGAAVVAAAPALGVAALPRAYFGRQRAARLRAVQAAWPDGLRDLGASITAGRSLTQALGRLAQDGPAALREEFARFPALARVLGTEPALEMVREELADPTSDRVIEVLVVAHERGGAVVPEIIADLVSATTRDVKLLDELETDGLEMRLNTRAVLALPWLVLVALTVRPGPFRDFYGSTGGLVVVAIGAAFSALGAWWVGRLARAEREPRVLGARP